MNMEIYYSYYAAKAAREKKDQPTHWIITPHVLGIYKLISVKSAKAGYARAEAA